MPVGHCAWKPGVITFAVILWGLDQTLGHQSLPASDLDLYQQSIDGSGNEALRYYGVDASLSESPKLNGNNTVTFVLWYLEGRVGLYFWPMKCLQSSQYSSIQLSIHTQTSVLLPSWLPDFNSIISDIWSYKNPSFLWPSLNRFLLLFAWATRGREFGLWAAVLMVWLMNSRTCSKLLICPPHTYPCSWFSVLIKDMSNPSLLQVQTLQIFLSASLSFTFLPTYIYLYTFCKVLQTHASSSFALLPALPRAWAYSWDTLIPWPWLLLFHGSHRLRGMRLKHEHAKESLRELSQIQTPESDL